MKISTNQLLIVFLLVIANSFLISGSSCFRSYPPNNPTITYPDGSRYQGSQRNGKPQGYGTMYYPDGSYYQGLWEEGNRHGSGMMIYPDGRQEEWEWRDGRQQRLPKN
jgi:hypothetical protein